MFDSFAVSARDYLRVSGPKPLMSRRSTFNTVGATGIPALREHIRKIGLSAARLATAEHAAALSVLVEEMKLWCTAEDDGTMYDRNALKALWAGSTFDDLHSPRVSVSATLSEELDKALSSSSERFWRDITSGLVPSMRDSVGTAARRNIELAVKTIAGDSALGWQQLKATFRRRGVWKGRNFNATIVHSLFRDFAAQWSVALDGNQFVDDAAAVKGILSLALARIEHDAAASLKPRVKKYKGAILRWGNGCVRSAITKLRKDITRAQKSISREMEADIREKLEPLYKRCAEHSKQGARDRSLKWFRDGLTDDIYSTVIERAVRSLREGMKRHVATYTAQIKNMVPEVRIRRLSAYIPDEVTLLWRLKIEARMSPIWDQPLPSKPFAEERSHAAVKLDDILDSIDRLKAEIGVPSDEHFE
ncbi:hypothetical protein EXIGLDRAFT_371863 [Exidia glandulosa HHB12029]|uniref:Uncharacterized protein n=1 Tax=Exidia glandulosa HHB12029 TaxID=1314781 RepID=A0A166BNK2_EXIGL|nr:hypothetical protein EXIGLDRAFT_371863 [Exidia glandulosa HHB12029]